MGEVEKGEEEVVEVPSVLNDVAVADRDADGLGSTSELLRSRGFGDSSRLVTGPLTRMMCVLAKTDFCSRGSGDESMLDLATFVVVSWLLVLCRRSCDVVSVDGDDADESRDARRPVTVMTVDVTGGEGGDIALDVDIDFGEICKASVGWSTLKARHKRSQGQQIEKWQVKFSPRWTK